MDFLENKKRLLPKGAQDLRELNELNPKLFKKFVYSAKGIYKVICLYLRVVSQKARHPCKHLGILTNFEYSNNKNF